MHLKKLRPLWLALLLTSLIPSGALQAAILPAGNLLPADTFFVFTIPDFNALRHAAGQSPKWLLWNDPALKPFHDKFMSKWNEQFFGPLEQDLGVSLDEYLTLPQGQLTLAVTRNGWDGQDLKQVPGLLFLLDTKDQSTVLATNLDLLRKKWTAAGKSIRTETVHGVPFSVVSLSSNDVPPTLAGLIPANQPVQELGANPEPAQPLEMVFAPYHQGGGSGRLTPHRRQHSQSGGQRHFHRRSSLSISQFAPILYLAQCPCPLCRDCSNSSGTAQSQRPYPVSTHFAHHGVKCLRPDELEIGQHQLSGTAGRLLDDN